MRRLVFATIPLLLVALGPTFGRGMAVSASAPAPADQSASATRTADKPPVSDLDRLLAPIALYPDQLLAQILLCSQDPSAVVRLNDWLARNAGLKGTELQDAATVEGFEPSFVALALFPPVVKEMARQPDWTSRLGKAFVADRQAVFDSIQRLRVKAEDTGVLKTTAQQEVETRTTKSGEQVIVIEPANPQVIYVPQYDPQIIYTQPTTTTTTVVVKEDDNTDEAIAAGVIGFTAGIAIGAAIDNDYYYGPYGFYGGAYMYNDAWDDYYDAREDAREDWMDHREDLAEERGERAGDAREQRTERTETRQEQRTERTESRPERSTSSYEARGHSGETGAGAASRSGASSDAFSGYSSGRTERAASSRGQRSRSSSRSSGGGGRRR